jgi:hypothetical protein
MTRRATPGSRPSPLAILAAITLFQACAGTEEATTSTAPAGAAIAREAAPAVSRPRAAKPAAQPESAAPSAAGAAHAQASAGRDVSMTIQKDAGGGAVATLGTGGTPRMGSGPTLAARHDGPLSIVNLTDLDVQRFSGDFAQWHDSWAESSVLPVTFRWSSGLQGLGSARWEVSDELGRLVAEGDAGAPPAAGKARVFSIDFRDFVTSQARPLNYFVEVRTFDATGASEVGPASDTNVVTFIAPGPMTQFTDAGLHPELYSRMPIRIDLDTLEIEGEGFDEDPYLFIAAIYADGTTVVPYIDWATREAHFPDSDVRVETKGATHENVPGGDPGDVLGIPDETGRFETILRQIGTRLAGQLSADGEQMRRMREGTQVAIVVIGFEEDAQPSTELVDELRATFVTRLHEELTRIVLDLRVPADAEEGLTLPDLGDVTDELQQRLKDELRALAEAKGVAEVLELLMLPAWPMIFAVGGANADDYIGHGRANFSYEQILQAGAGGLPINLLLDQNCKCDKPRYLQNDRTETIAYRIRGSVRLLLE